MRSVEVVHDGKGHIYGVWSSRCSLMWKFVETMFGTYYHFEDVGNKKFVYDSRNGDCFCVIETRSVV